MNTENIFGKYFPDPFRKTGKLWTSLPFFIWIFVNLIYSGFWITACFLVVLQFSFVWTFQAIMELVLDLIKTIWVGLTVKNGQAVSRIKKIW